MGRWMVNTVQALWCSGTAVEASLWLLNLACVFYLTRYLFGLNSLAVYWGWDPKTILAFIGERQRLSSIIFGLGADLINGLGNISYTVNPRWFPSYMLTMTGAGIIEDKPLSFAIGATELFAATALCGRINGFLLGRSMAAGWLITLMTWHLFGWSKILTLWSFFPHHAELVSVSALTACAALHLGTVSMRQLVLLSVAVFAGISYIVFAEPTSLILALPVIGAFAASRLILARDMPERIRIASCWALIGIASLVLYGRYVVGLIRYTAAAEFPDISRRALTLYGGEVSLFLWTPIYGLDYASIFTPQRTIMGAALIGAVLIIWLGSIQQRRVAVAVLIGQVTFTTLGLTNYLFDYWFGPEIWYFELFLFPYYALCACFLLYLPVALVTRWMRRPQEHPSSISERLVALTVPVAVILFIPAVPRPAHTAEIELLHALASHFPQPETAITRILKSEIALGPGRPFRGRVANLTGSIFPDEREWKRYSLVHFFAQLATGNLHDGPGLWQDDIPTLLEYNTLITPANFVFLRTLLTKPTDIVTRNIIGTRRINQHILRLIGIRFILTDCEVPGARLRAQLAIPTPLKSRELLGYPKLQMENFQLYLYELDDVNVGQYSPTEIKVAKNAGEVLTLLSGTDVPFAKTVFVTDPIREELSPALFEALTVERDGYRIRAMSQGRSVLLLPIEFSRCWKIAGQTSASAVRLFRADLLLTGVLFEGRLDAQILFHTGPFSDSACRLQDLADNKAISIGNVFQDRPEFGVLGLPK
jgi:hypothetical protein